ncbi:MAG: PD-(D/E)XK nuclease family transposase, partial [Clostridia bacterium]|nr:PD-(D/E)XK nuclease family transposase [Clostridia bacterium]
MKYINIVDIIKEEIAIIKKLNLKTDIIFRTFFSRKGNEYFLIDFLNALLNVEIKSIEIRDEVSLERLSTFEKVGRLELQAKIDNGTIVNIEMQVS